jgi:hypothetical protein
MANASEEYRRARPQTSGGATGPLHPFRAPSDRSGPEVHRILNTTNLIESLNFQPRKITRNRGHFPSDDALFKLLYFGAPPGGRWTDATAETFRRRLVAMPARLVRTARTIKLRFPRNWPWADAYHTGDHPRGPRAHLTPTPPRSSCPTRPHPPQHRNPARQRQPSPGATGQTLQSRKCGYAARRRSALAPSDASQPLPRGEPPGIPGGSRP